MAFNGQLTNSLQAICQGITERIKKQTTNKTNSVVMVVCIKMCTQMGSVWMLF